MKKEILFGILYYHLVPKTENRENGLFNWEGPFKVHQVLPGNAYWLESLQGEPHKRCINGKYLKRYFPTIWEIVETSEKN